MKTAFEQALYTKYNKLQNIVHIIIRYSKIFQNNHNFGFDCWKANFRNHYFATYQHCLEYEQNKGKVIDKTVGSGDKITITATLVKVESC